MEKDRIIPGRSLVVIGGSAGSLDVILHVLPLLKKGLSIPIIIVLHRKTSEENILADLLAAKTKLPVREVEDGDAIDAGTIYIVPADYHLLLEKEGSFSLDASEKVNYSRPSIDVTFESASEAFGAGVIAILLSGGNADGSEGMKRIKANGGICIVQSPETATAPFMPREAIREVAVDSIMSAGEIAVYMNGL